MQKSGIVITLFYALVVIFLLLPVSLLIGGAEPADYGDSFKEWLVWVVVGALIIGEGLLLFLSVDTSHKKLKPRQHVIVSVATAALLFALLFFAAFAALSCAIWADEVFEKPFSWLLWGRPQLIGWWLGLWLFWGALFYLYLRESSTVITRLTAWLLKGSILELLVAVPCHIIVRRREDCSAPAVTGLGMGTGIAIMLLSFGPSILFLYKKKLAAYKARR